MKKLDSLYNNVYNLKNIKKFTNTNWKYSKILQEINKRLKSELKSFLSFQA